MLELRPTYLHDHEINTPNIYNIFSLLKMIQLQMCS
jgi:hypothetical protein